MALHFYHLFPGDKDPMISQFAQDFIYKGVAHLENKDFKQLQLQRKNDLLKCLNEYMNVKSYEELGPSTNPCQRAAIDFINCGTTTSLFGYKINTPSSVAVLIRLKRNILKDKEKREAACC
ncbi:Hypothetical predicted protein [Paramuricea clavata]|nr:Hypothetical predicted protein [Paramuricea clavata]